MNIKTLKQQIKNNARWENVTEQKLGGQSCEIPQSRQRLVSDELSIKIEVGYHRSTLKNKELVCALFDLAIDELVR